MSVLKKLAGETLSYGFSTIIGRSLNFLLVLVHTKAFSPSELGINVKLYSYIAIATILYTYGMETAYFRFAKENPQYDIRLLATVHDECVLEAKTEYVSEVVKHVKHIMEHAVTFDIPVTCDVKYGHTYSDCK